MSILNSVIKLFVGDKQQKDLKGLQPIVENVRKFETAFSKRQSLLETNTNSYRLLFGENDGFPGLIADKYATVLVVKLYNLLHHFLHILDAPYSAEDFLDFLNNNRYQLQIQQIYLYDDFVYKELFSPFLCLL